MSFDLEHTPYLYYIPEIYHHCTLNNFDFTGQKRLVSILKKFVEGSGKRAGLYFYGGFGVGKSHLLVSLYRIKVSQMDDPSTDVVYYTSFEKLIREAKESSEVIEMVCETECLFLDDISAIPIRDQTSEILRFIINSRYESKLVTCFAANLSTKQLEQEGLHPHAVSRVVGMCEVFKIVGSDRRRE